MHLTLRQLQIFHAVARTGSTTAAAAGESLSQSAASAALNALEDILGERLFDRVGKRLLLNDNGRALLPAARAALDAALEIETRFARGGDGLQARLKVHASTTVGNYVLPGTIAAFCRRHPQSSVELHIGNTFDVAVAVQEFAADIGFIEGPCRARDVVVSPWHEDELVLVAAVTHPLARAAKRARLTVAHLSRAQWLMREPGSGTREAVEAALAPYPVDVASAMTVGGSEAIKHAVAEGLGISWLSRHVVGDFVAAKRLCILRTELPRVTRLFSLIRHRRKVPSTALQVFVDHCVPRTMSTRSPPPC